MNHRVRRRFAFFAAVLLIFAVAAVSIFVMRGTVVKMHRKEAENILYYYSEKIMLQLQGVMNEADALARTAYGMDQAHVDHAEWFARAAEPLLERDEVCWVYLFQGDVLVNALPADKFKHLVGRDLQEFSYIYTLAKVVKALVVEGPIVVKNDPEQQEVFVFLQPIVEQDAYLGEVAVALKREYVLEQLELDRLYAQGYDYQLWRVEPQDGRKEIIACSRPSADFSRAPKQVFNLPTQWTLSIQPAGGWIGTEQQVVISVLGLLLAALLLTLAFLARRLAGRELALRKKDEIDQATGLYNRKGFAAALNRWLMDGAPVMLFYFSMEGYTPAARLMGPAAERAFLQSIPARLDDYINSPFLAGRLDESSYIVALQEKMEEQQQEDFAKGLSLELLLQVRIHGKKNFLPARYQYSECQTGGRRAEEEISDLIEAYYDRVEQESPVRMLTEKCRQLMEGNSDVAFDEYTDVGMMELSKTFNRYRKQVEQLAYSDPVFRVGNRPKYLRDTNMLISYDKKRRFSLYCIDICSFNQYNELFSADIGDEILHEVLRRLSRPFGAYLYRINGDVFLGISQTEESAESFISRLQDLFTAPITVSNLSFMLQIRIAACLYPEHGDSPSALLEHIQSALRFAKESEQAVVLYNRELDKIIRTEADILHRLQDAIRQKTLEVWYQPIMRLQGGRYSTAEALVRLPDGKGGFFSASQVIALAERNGAVKDLGNYVLHQACVLMREQGGRLGLQRVGINLSVQQLVVGNSADLLLELIRTAGADPHRITLEITESILIQSLDRAAQALEKLRQAGVHIALDDFGVGYSSLNYLSNLPVDIIKIDRSLTQQILTDSKQYALLKAIVEMASMNDLVVVAEGVETRAEQEAIAAAGVPYIQGYYYARPMPGKDLIRFLER